MKNAFSFIFGFLTVTLLSASFYFYFGRNTENMAIESINLTASTISKQEKNDENKLTSTTTEEIGITDKDTNEEDAVSDSTSTTSQEI